MSNSHSSSVLTWGALTKEVWLWGKTINIHNNKSILKVLKQIKVLKQSAKSMSSRYDSLIQICITFIWVYPNRPSVISVYSIETKSIHVLFPCICVTSVKYMFEINCCSWQTWQMMNFSLTCCYFLTIPQTAAVMSLRWGSPFCQTLLSDHWTPLPISTLYWSKALLNNIG